MTLAVKTIKQIKALRDKMTRSNKTETLNELHELLTSKDFSDATLRVSYSTAKNLFAEKSKDNGFLARIKAPNALIKKVNEMSEENRRNRNCLIVNRTDLEKIKSLSKSDNIYDRALFLLFVSGRRTE